MICDHLFNMKFTVQRLLILLVIQNSNFLKETINKHFGETKVMSCVYFLPLLDGVTFLELNVKRLDFTSLENFNFDANIFYQKTYNMFYLQ